MADHEQSASQAAELHPALSRRVGEIDVKASYTLFLGRSPESVEAVADKLDMTLDQLLRQFLGSSEFEDRMIRPVLSGRLPAGGVLDTDLDPTVIAWAADILPLASQSRSRLRRATTWLSALDILLQDGDLAATLQGLDTIFAPHVFAERLHALAHAVGAGAPTGEISEASGLIVRGWAMDRNATDATVLVELWVDGVFAAASPADEFRRELQDRFGTGGVHGFTFEGFSPPRPDSERALSIEVKDAVSRVVLAARRVEWRPEQDSADLGLIGAELKAVRQTLSRLDEAVRRIGGAFGFTLANYDAYRRAYYTPTPAGREADRREAAGFARRPGFAVLVAAPPRSELALERTLNSLRNQSYRDFRLLLMGSCDAAAAAGTVLAPAQVVTDTDVDGVIASDDLCVITTAGVAFAADALHRFASAFQDAGAIVAYADSDTLERGPGGAEVFIDPVLRPDFDPDLLLQTPYLGETLVASSAHVRALLAKGGSLGEQSRPAFVLAACAGLDRASVAHVQRILTHSDPDMLQPSASYVDIVGAHLRDSGSAAQAAAQDEAFVGGVGGAVRVFWPLRDGVKAAVVVPTRDRLDLLGPCLAGLIASQANAAVDFEVVVVDNASTGASTRRFLDAMNVGRRIRLIDFDAPFNWSAINNHAAREVDAEVLIFLNNDTVVLTPDWADELCRQALRPEIGAVGARLLYEDGSIQHAGVVLGGFRALADHEGLGAAPADAGYLGRRSLVHRASAVTGACLATRRDVFEALGGFDEDRLALEANDIDYCLRVRRNGLGVLYDPYCTLYHFESKSRGHTGADADRRRRADEELAVLERRWGDALRDDPYYNAHFDRGSRPFTKLGPPPEFSVRPPSDPRQ